MHQIGCFKVLAVMFKISWGKAISRLKGLNTQGIANFEDYSSAFALFSKDQLYRVAISRAAEDEIGQNSSLKN